MVEIRFCPHRPKNSHLRTASVLLMTGDEKEEEEANPVLRSAINPALLGRYHLSRG
jgi:hypothetical protein